MARSGMFNWSISRLWESLSLPVEAEFASRTTPSIAPVIIYASWNEYNRPGLSAPSREAAKELLSRP